jgi:hypothetical protein
MSYRYKFYEGAFNHFFDCPMKVLEEDIERSHFSLMGRTMFRNVREANAHQGCVERLEVLKLIAQLRKGEITMEGFHVNVKITK